MRPQLRRNRTVMVNQSYAMQRVTGQQRYAMEIAERLGAAPPFRTVAPQGFWAGTTLRVWFWVSFVLPLVAGSAVVLSMTSRAPFWRRRHVLVIHDVFVLTHPEWYSRLYVLTHAPLLRLQIRSAAALVAVSQPVADELAHLYDGPVMVAPNAPSRVFAGDRRPTAWSEQMSALSDLGLVAGQYLLTVGSMDPRKNLPRLASAYRSLPSEERAAHPLVVVGGGNAIYRSEQIDWPDEVVFAGYVTDEDLRQLYAGALAVVFPTLAEGFGLPLVEAAAAGASGLVISDIPVFRWICGDDAHYVDPTSVSSIAAGLTAGIHEPRSQEINLDRFNWDSSARVVADLCLAVTGRD